METARNFHKFKTNIRVSKRKTKSSMFQRSWSFGTPFRHNGKESLENPRKRDMNTWPLQYYGLHTTLILWQPAFLIWPNCDAAKQNYFSRDALKMVRRYLIVFLNEGMSTITQKKNNSRNSHRCQGDPSAFSPCHLDVQPCLLEDTTAQNLPSDHNCLQLNCDKIKSKTSTTVTINL